jgi:hypothetical protein
MEWPVDALLLVLAQNWTTYVVDTRTSMGMSTFILTMLSRFYEAALENYMPLTGISWKWDSSEVKY